MLFYSYSCFKHSESKGKFASTLNQMALPTEWTVKQADNPSTRFYYFNTEKKYSVWVRPVPPAGNEFTTWPKYIRASHILVKHKKVRNPVSSNVNTKNRPIVRTEKDALQKITKILNDIRHRNKNFEMMAQELSDCSSSKYGGDLGWFEPHVMDPTFVQKVLELDYGEISEPFQTPSGWHICKRTDGDNKNKLNSKMAIPLNLEFPSLDEIPKPKISTLYASVFKTENTPNDISAWKELISLLVQIKCYPNIIYQHLKSMLYFHPTKHEAIEFGFKLVEEKLPTLISDYVAVKELKRFSSFEKQNMGSAEKIQLIIMDGKSTNFRAKLEKIANNENKTSHEKLDLIIQKRKEFLAEEIKNKYIQDFFERLLSYTWNPMYWNWSLKNATETFEIRKNMVHQIGFTYNCSSIWTTYLRELANRNEPHFLCDEIKWVLHSCIRYNAELLKTLTEISSNVPEEERAQILDRIEYLQQFNKSQQNQIIIQNKPEFALYHKRLVAKELLTERVGESRTIEYVRSERDSAFKDWISFIDDELSNPLDLPQDIYVANVDYSFRLALTELWWMPRIWLRYARFMMSHSLNERAFRIIDLAKRNFDGKAIFEFGLADLFMEMGHPEEAVTLYESLLKEEKLRDSALTLLFKHRLESGEHGSKAARDVVAKHIDIISPRFLVNAAKLARRDAELAWFLYQLGVDRFPDNTELVLETASYLAAHGDIRNTRMLLTQAKSEVRDPFSVIRRLFEVELANIAPLDHLNETQKSFGGSVEAYVLHMHRFRFLDLYPLSVDDLVSMAHYTTQKSIDIVELPTSQFVTSVPPYRVDPKKLMIRKDYSDIIGRAGKSKPSGETVIKFKPAIEALAQAISSLELTAIPPTAEEVVKTVRAIQIKSV